MVAKRVVVHGAYGHTGRFVVAALRERGVDPVLAGRDGDRLDRLAEELGLAHHRTDLDDADHLADVLGGANAVINCAGPFAVTAAPLIEAALRVRVPYLDIAAEPDVVEDVFDRFDGPAREAGVPVVPALGFYGGLGDLLVAATAAEWDTVSRVDLAIALSSWVPTPGTTATIELADERRGGQRLVFEDGRLHLRGDAAPTGTWDFPPPIGTRPVAWEFTTADAITIARRTGLTHIGQCITTAALADLDDPSGTGPRPVDEHGRSAQEFLIEAVVERHGEERRGVVAGQDIYAVTGPIAAELTYRLLDSPIGGGVRSAAQVADPTAVLTALAPALHAPART